MRKKFLYLKEQCKVCGGKGYRWSDNRAWKNGEVEQDPIQCDCLKKIMLYTNLDNANVPREYYDLTLDEFKESHEDKASLKKFVHTISLDPDTFFNKGHNIFFLGPNGTGKTMLAIEVLKAALRKKHTIHYEFFPIICEAFSKKGYKADEVKEKYDRIFSDVDFLVIDELGKETEQSDQETARRLLEIHILKKRGGKPTILLANMYDVVNQKPYTADEIKAEIKSKYGLSVLSMLGNTWHFKDVFDVDARGGK